MSVDRDAEKRAAAHAAVALVRSGDVVGLGSGSTALVALEELASRLRTGLLADIVAVPTSRVVESAARRLAIPLTDLAGHPVIDITIDGADEVDPQWRLIKGGGGALLREKIVAQASRREVIVIDHTKLSDRLGLHHRLPVEVVEFGWRPEALHIEQEGAAVTLRPGEEGAPFRTDGGNLILDVDLASIRDPVGFAEMLRTRAGVVEVGLFDAMTDDLVVGGPDGVVHESRPRA
jgi:ribose 5-phosphate isomerase A